MKEYSSSFRYAFNRLNDNYTDKDIRSQLNNLTNLNNLDSWTKQCSINDAKQLIKANEELKKLRIKEANQLIRKLDKLKKLNDYQQKQYKKSINFLNNPNKSSIFGGKLNFIKRLKNQITNEEFKELKLRPIYIEGQKAEKGNRKFLLDIINNNQIIYRLNRHNHYVLTLPKLRNNYLKDLEFLEQLNDNEGHTYSIRLDKQFIYIMYEPLNLSKELNFETYLGIDLNPEFIGISIKKKDEVIYTNCFNLTGISKKIFNEKDKEVKKYLNNKLNHEILEISKQISKISIHYRCKYIFYENLDFKEEEKSKWFNRLTRNIWKRNLLIDNLEKRSKLNFQKMFSISPEYSSIIGNLIYEYIDPINSSIEIGRRGYEIIIKRSKKFFPEIRIKDSLKHQWKEKVNELPESWKELFDIIKNFKLRYRVSTESVVFSKFKHKKSYISYLYN
jgi:hypothetical protein